MDKIKVMLVEDHVLVREGTRELLPQPLPQAGSGRGGRQ